MNSVNIRPVKLHFFFINWAQENIDMVLQAKKGVSKTKTASCSVCKSVCATIAIKIIYFMICENDGRKKTRLTNTMVRFLKSDEMK